MSNHLSQYKKQAGSALIVSLSILLVLTILGVSAMRTTSLEERMAGNARDAQMAFEAAEAALREGETFVVASLNNDAYTSTGGPGGLYTERGVNADAWTVEGNWATAIQVPYTTQVARLPRFMVQLISANVGLGQAADLGNAGSYNTPAAAAGYYQITARGTGISPNSRAMLQSYFSK